MGSNAAAWITGAKVSPLEVRDAPYPRFGSSDVIVENAFVAINPLEYKIQDNNPPVCGREIRYPTILGADMAGTIITTGSEVVSYKIGDRVIANAPGVAAGRPANSAFQHFVSLPESSLILVPDHISLEAAVVLPLGCDTAMAGLFVPSRLGLSTAGLEAAGLAIFAAGSAVLIWGGSSSMGCCAIQMASAAGYEVYTLASACNHALCISLGADKAFDYANPDVEDLVTQALMGKAVFGALDCISDKKDTIPACARILAKTRGRKKVITVLAPPATGLVEGVEVQRVSIPELRASKSYDIVHSWLARALKNGTLKPKPDSVVIGKGLENVQRGLDVIRKGVSASKVVVAL